MCKYMRMHILFFSYYEIKSESVKSLCDTNVVYFVQEFSL